MSERKRGITRGQMVQLMVDKANERHKGESILEPGFAHRLASTMLEACEEAGMLPPQRDAENKSSYGYAQLWRWEKE